MKRTARSQALLSVAGPLLVFGLPAALFLWWGRTHLHGVEHGIVVALGAFGLWRYGWQLLNYVRAGIYATWYYPRLRAQAEEVAAKAHWPDRIFIVVASYLEEPWVSVESMQSLMSNIADVPCKATVVVAVGSDGDEALIASVYRAHPARGQVELVFQRQSQGKRAALGHALRAVARRHRDEPNSVTVLMDGDSWLEPGGLARCLPFFLAYRDLGAATTNEVAFIPNRSLWHRDWFGLKFGQRHVLFQSHSLSNKVLTLTGRFSIFRTSIVVEEEFIASIERDSVDHWLHGELKFLMGDDKSSWFHVLRKGWNMLYLPDVTCCSLESRETPFFEASVSLPYRWFGNTLRNNPRALALGPARVGGFIWLALLDQRLSMWTSLVGLAGAVALAVAKSVLFIPLYLAWAVIVRSLQLLVIGWHGHAVTMRTIPLMLYTQWVGALVKIHAWHHLGDQSWSKGKAQQARGARGFVRRLVPGGVMVMSYLLFGAAVLLAHSMLRWPAIPLFAAEAAPTAIDARQHGVTPDDGRDDAAALQALLERVAGRGPVTIALPGGVLDFHRPVVIRHSDVSLAGAGREQTRIVSHIRGTDGAVIRVEGTRGPVIAELAQPLAGDARRATLDRAAALQAGDYVWLRQPNDDALFRQLGSREWKREQPFLRQSMLKVASSEGNAVEFDTAAGIAFAARASQLMRLRPVQRVRLADFRIEQRNGTQDIAQARFRYENLAPELAVDGISLEWTADVAIERVGVFNAGRHPLAIENSSGFLVQDCVLDGAWNKGDGGSGYLRIARAFHGKVEGCKVRNIRHIAVQWSSAFNRIENVDSEVDVNFHGGYSHHNEVHDVRFAIPREHKWGPVFVTPANARWAPPDGPGNRVTASPSANRAPPVHAASPAR
ncbi:glycosyltransferase [Ramlibacter sp.]|uniref:glycosyltransferase n=1 Tax=Ramlibacter sp. TaxID=1917967 RepID=UPI003D0AE8D8